MTITSAVHAQLNNTGTVETGLIVFDATTGSNIRQGTSTFGLILEHDYQAWQGYGGDAAIGLDYLKMSTITVTNLYGEEIPVEIVHKNETVSVDPISTLHGKVSRYLASFRIKRGFEPKMRKGLIINIALGSNGAQNFVTASKVIRFDPQK